MSAPRRHATERVRRRIVATERPRQVAQDAIPCVLGQDLTVDPRALSRCCSGELTERADDLLVIAGVIGHADRSVRRATSQGWLRELDLTVPVLDPAFWRRSDIAQALRDLLRLLTGDAWSFTYTHRQHPLRTDPVAPMRLRDSDTDAVAVMPYSDGLDSFASARLLNGDEPNTRLILITSGRHTDPDQATIKGGTDTHRFRITTPIHAPSTTRFDESSARSRPLIYNVLGAIAASMAGTRRIIVAESGQGSLGPSLVRVGNETPDVRTHPAFTMALERFFALTLETVVAFERPHLWHTKGETLAALVKSGKTQGWQQTRSCARQRHMVRNGHRVHCGLCAACLLRRVSLCASGLDDNTEPYMWTDLSAPDFTRLEQTSGKKMTKNDKDQAFCGAMAMEYLARCDQRSVSHEAWTLARALQCPNEAQKIEGQLRQLVDTHAREWRAFVDAWGPKSLLAHWTAS